MTIDFINNPVIKSSFKAKFYWTGNVFEDAERINRPHIKAEGDREDRIQDTIDIINTLAGASEITLEDMFNIQNTLLKNNNYKGIRPGFRFHNVNFDDAPQFCNVRHLTEIMFPVKTMPKEHLLEWYRQMQAIHPLSDLNGRVFGIIVAVLNMNLLKK